MIQFTFGPKNDETFVGRIFYEVYKDAEFLRSGGNVENILSRGHELRQCLKKVPPGQTIVLENMRLEKNTPLLVKNTIAGANVPVENYEFTFNRLAGLTAAYAYEHRYRFPAIKASEALALGLVWDSNDEQACKLYLSAVSGTEHFPQFSFYPLVCALKKLELKKITIDLVIKIAKIKNDNGQRLAHVLTENYMLTTVLWKRFPPHKQINVSAVLTKLPEKLKKVFFERPH